MGILVNESQIGGGGPSNTSHNIGDIFYTTRTDNSLNGAVECNGSQYNFSDFDSNLQALFDDGSIPSVTINKFDSMVTNQGGCDSFGYKTDTEWGQWDVMPGYVYTKKPSVAVGDPVYDTPGGNIIAYITVIDNENRTLIYYEGTDGVSNSAYWNASVNGPVESTPYFKVPKKLSRVLVRTQKPTSSNKYTYFNLYADGWVEQGGTFNIDSLSLTPGTTKVYTGINFPIELKESPKIINIENNMSFFNNHFLDETTTSMSIKVSSQLAVDWTEENKIILWKVSGYAIESEYTKDKWNYQNVQVERPMVQLFNGNTDTALATCTSVLTDVSTLKDSLSTFKFKKVEALPDNPDTDTVYFII